MSNYTYNSVSVALPEHVEISPEAGTLSIQQIRRLTKPYTSKIGTFCQKLAKVMEDNPQFIVPEVDAAALRAAGAKSADIKEHIEHIENLLRAFKQQSMLNDDAAYRLVRQVNDRVNSQSKYNAWIKVKFKLLEDLFRKKRSEPEVPVEQASEGEADPKSVA